MKQVRISTNWYIGCISFVVLCYIIARAFLCGVTYDEAWTLSGFVPYSYTAILNYEPCDANNHLLNTLSIKFLFSVFPDSLFVARIPNILGGLLYLLFSAAISRRYAAPVSAVAFTLLALNPFALEFFSLARGYGMALGLLSASLFYGLLFMERQRLLHLFLSILFLSFSVSAAFSYIHLYLAGQLFYFYTLLKADKKIRFTGLLIQTVLFIGLTLLLYTPIQKLRANDNLYYGGSTGLFEDTLLSLTTYFVGTPPAGSESRIGLTLFLFLLFALGLPLIRKNQMTASLRFALSLLLLSLLSITSQFYLLGTLYVTDRTALFLYPLFMLLLAELVQGLHPGPLRTSVLTGLLFCVFLNFFLSVNFYKTKTWSFDAQSENVLRYIASAEKNTSVNLQCSWPMTKSIAYYQSHFFPSIQSVYKPLAQAVNDGDYYFYLDTSIDQVDYARGREHLRTAAKDTLLKFEEEHLYLFRLKRTLNEH
jgi:hypothetical protein